jgi:hypothetical protein
LDLAARTSGGGVTTKNALLWMLGALGLGFGSLYLIGQKGPEKAYEPDALSACVAAQRLALGNLKAPRTAQHCDCLRAKAEALGNREWRVFSCVDSQNSFGALIRTNYATRVAYVGDVWVQRDFVPMR